MNTYYLMFVFINAFKSLPLAHYLSISAFFFLYLKVCLEEIALNDKDAFAQISF